MKIVLLLIIINAEVAQLVERNLAKVEVAGSNLVFRSLKFHLGLAKMEFLFNHPGGGTGRRAGLKILFPETEVRVQFPSRVRLSQVFFG